MKPQLQQLNQRSGRRFKRVLGAVIGPAAVGMLKVIRRMDPDRSADRAGRLLRRLGPCFREHRLGRANLTAAYPDKSPQEIEEILLGVWDNLGRVGAEYAFLDRIWDFDPARPSPGRIEVADATIERFLRLRDDGKPALIFTAHLANWELPLVAAAATGLKTAFVFRNPNVSNVATAIRQIRASHEATVIPATREAPFRIASALDAEAHVGMLVDQRHDQGLEVDFFGRRCKVNPLIARMARHYDCPVHGTRVIRLPGHRFRLEVTEALVPARDDKGEVDVQATMQTITSIVEGWIREYPEQWLWLHRRWR